MRPRRCAGQYIGGNAAGKGRRHPGHTTERAGKRKKRESAKGKGGRERKNTEKRTANGGQRKGEAPT